MHPHPHFRHPPPMKKDGVDHRKMVVGVAWSFGDVKLLLASLLLLCSIATVIQFIPSRFHLPDLAPCLHAPLNDSSARPPPPPEPHHLSRDSNPAAGVVKRSFIAVGSAAYLFVQMGAYRGGAATFAAVGLASKPLHVFAKPRFLCEWVPRNGNGSTTLSVEGYKMLPDWGYGRVYTVVVVNCTFPAGADAGASGSGGRLLLRATSDSAESQLVALEESPGIVNATDFNSPPEFDYLYCGSPLFGNLSPQRIREWVAYHVRLFGGRSHFVIYDAGGVHAAVMEVLRPWIEKGFVTLEDVREQERFDGYYHNQFLVLNDGLHKHKFKAKWMFFFDVDEFLYVEPRTTMASLMASMAGYTQFTIEQMPMSNQICLSEDEGKTSGMWGMEKLVYRNVKRGVRRDRKYAIQPRSVFATGIHMSQSLAGRTSHKTERRIMYFHYHGTVAERREPCREFTNSTELTVDKTPFVRDDTLRKVVREVKKFEHRAIGSRLWTTRQ